MKLRTQKITALMAAAVLGASTFGGVSVMAAGSTEAWVFSAGYNLWYNLVTLVVCIIIVPTLIDRLTSATNIKFKA